MQYSPETLSIEALQTGLAQEGGSHTCLECGQVFEEGEVYPMDGHFYEAARAARHHAATAHAPPLDRLLDGGSKYLTLTDNQKKLLRLMAGGRSDTEIAAETGTSTATVRRQRFAFREKAKQASMYLAVYGLADIAKPAPRPAQKKAETEAEKALKGLFYTLDPPRLKTLPAKEKRRILAVEHIASLFSKGRSYTEPEVNEILRAVHADDYVSLRRYLIVYGFLAREKDGSRYWVPQEKEKPNG